VGFQLRVEPRQVVVRGQHRQRQDPGALPPKLDGAAPPEVQLSGTRGICLLRVQRFLNQG
jgi:hypothetical protein